MATDSFPYTGTWVGRDGINASLSTQIVVKVGDNSVGALQTLRFRQGRGLTRIKEIGTDGVIEIVPTSAAEYTINVDRMVFDQLRLPEAFSRGFRFIGAQRLPFDIMVVDFSGHASSATLDTGDQGVISMVYKNCWFSSYETPYNQDNYLITESAEIWCETAYVSTPSGHSGDSVGLNSIEFQQDAAGIEEATNYGNRRGAVDAPGLINAVFEG